MTERSLGMVQLVRVVSNELVETFSVNFPIRSSAIDGINTVYKTVFAEYHCKCFKQSTRTSVNYQFFQSVFQFDIFKF